MSELVMTFARLGYLLLLWAMVWAVVVVLRRDLYGTKISARRQRAVPATAHGAVPPPPVKAAASTRSRLVVIEGPLAGTQIPLTSASVLIGRAPGNTLVIDDDYASSRHARIFPDHGAWAVEDLGSTNGTFLAGERVSAPAPLPPGVPLRVGTTVLELQR